jgi:hypothetical protein
MIESKILSPQELLQKEICKVAITYHSSTEGASKVLELDGVAFVDEALLVENSLLNRHSDNNITEIEFEISLFDKIATYKIRLFYSVIEKEWEIRTNVIGLKEDGNNFLPVIHKIIHLLRISKVREDSWNDN